MLFVLISCLLNFGQSDLIGRWDFRSSLLDETGYWPTPVSVLNTSTWSTQGLSLRMNGSGHVLGFTGTTIREKTLISWFHFDDVSDPRSAGSVLTVDAISSDTFDGIVWGEKGAYDWMPGSSYYNHTVNTAAQTTQINVDVKMAITYRDAGNSTVEIIMYKDDQLVIQYTNGSFFSWAPNDVELYWGQRFGDVGSGPGYLVATIYASEIHNVVLTQSQIILRSSSPTTAPTFSPTTTFLTKTPSQIPTGITSPRPSKAPSSVSSVVPSTLTPTAYPTCATCDLSVNLTSNVSQVLTVGDTIISVPSNLVDIPNASIRITVVTIDAGPPLPVSDGGTSGPVIISIVISQDNVTLSNGSILLLHPISFVIPLEKEQTCPLRIPQCVWRKGDSWVNSGCEAVLTVVGVQCTCTHLTDFAVLLDQDQNNKERCEQSTDIYYPFVACYIVVILYCVVILFLLCLKGTMKVSSTRTLMQNYFLIALVAVLRLLSCLRYLHVFGIVPQVVVALITAAPYSLEFLLFSLLASSWIGLAHFTMSSQNVQWSKVRMLFICVNIVGTLCSVGLFVLFIEYTSIVTAAVGTAVLAVFYFILAITFQYYSRAVARDLTRLVPSSSVRTTGSRCSCTLDQRIKWVGRVVAVSFALQACIDVIAIVTPNSQLTVWTALFLLCNLVALAALLAVYYTAFMRVLKLNPLTKLTKSSSSISGDAPISMNSVPAN